MTSHSHNAFTPPEELPSPVAVPHHCGRCPPAVSDALPPFRAPKHSTRPTLRANRPSPPMPL